MRLRTLILANGTPPSRDLAQRLAASSDLILATDGAAHSAAALGISPDIICGDFDSVRKETAQSELPDAEWVPTPNQSRTDLEKAILLAQSRGATSLLILGANGGRIDHALANFALLLRYHTAILLRIVEDGAEVWAVSGGLAVPGESRFRTLPGDTVSLISLDGAASVSVSGVRWPLTDCNLPLGTLGVSNEATGEEVTVTVRGGAILVCQLYPVSADSL